MTLFEIIKFRLGIFYSDPIKDSEVQSRIDGALSYFRGAGWDTDTANATLTDAVELYCKMAQSTDPAQLANHPVLISYVAQGRAGSA